MIIDKIENAARYYGLSEGIAEAFEFIKNNDLTETPAGKYDISDTVKMNVNEYEQSCTDRIRMEAHLKNIDVQYWVKGTELMGYAPYENQPEMEPFNEAKDCGHYPSQEAVFSKFEPGMFAIYFTEELHTAVKDDSNSSNQVKKVVFKVLAQ